MKTIWAGRLVVIATLLVLVSTYVYGIVHYGWWLGITIGWLPALALAWLTAQVLACGLAFVRPPKIY